jgi:CHASE2 domain-containing sensor protein
MRKTWWQTWIWQPVRKKGAWHWAIFACLLVAGWFLGQILEHASVMTTARYWLYRRQMQLVREAPTHPRHTVVVLLTDEDYWSENFAGRSPVDRKQLAKILTILTDVKAQTVALDIDLRSPDSTCPGCDFASYQTEDLALFHAMANLCKPGGGWLVVGTSVRFADGEYTEVPSLYSWAMANDPEGKIACMKPGYLQLPHDLRKLPGPLFLKNGSTLDSFAMAAEQRANGDAYARAAQAPERAFLFARYLSEANFGDQNGPFLFSAKSLEKMHVEDPNRLRQYLSGRVVLIGGAWHTTGIGQGPRVDLYDSPMGQMPGVFLHANYIEALDGERGTFAALPDWVVRCVEFTLAVALALIGAQQIGAIWKGMAFCISVLISFVLTYLLLENLGIFMDFLVPLCILIVHTLVEQVIAWRHELHHLRHEKGGRHVASTH